MELGWLYNSHLLPALHQKKVHSEQQTLDEHYFHIQDLLFLDQRKSEEVGKSSSCLPSYFEFIDFSQKDKGVNCTIYQDYFRTDCENEADYKAGREGDGTLTPLNNTIKVKLTRNECLGCYIDNYCKYIAKMFEIQDKLEWWMQPRLFLYFLGASGLMMAAIGFYIYAKLRDIYPYNLIATACLTEAAIYWRFMRMIVCPTQIFVILINMFPVYGWEISYYQYYQSFQTVIVLFAAQIYAFAVVNLSMQLFICYDFF
jgi:hypothetical protein